MSIYRPKVLLLTRNFPPMIGGMERYNLEMVAQLAREFDVFVSGPAGCESNFPEDVQGVGSRLDPLPAFLLGNAFRGWRAARRARPDVILAGSGLTAPAALLIARFLRKPVGVFVYGLDLIASSRVYQSIWVPAIRRCDFVMPISRFTFNLAKEKGVADAKMTIVPPGVNQASMDIEGGAALRRQLDIGDRPLIACVGRLVPRKGLVEFVDQVLPAILAEIPEAVVVVAGDDSPTSLHRGDGTVAVRALRIASSRGMAEHLKMLGRVDDDVLRSLWSAADLHAFPVLQMAGDAEGFGIVCLEAASYGVPTVAFAVGGVPDAVAEGRSGHLIDSGDYVGFASAVVRSLRKRDDAPVRSACRSFADEFAWDAIGVGLRSMVRARASSQAHEAGDGH